MNKLINFLVRYNISLFIIFCIFSFIALLIAKNSQISYHFARTLPQTNETYIQYQENKSIFPNNSGIILISYKDDSFFYKKHLQNAYDFYNNLNSITLRKYVLSPFNAIELEPNFDEEVLKPEKIYHANDVQIDTNFYNRLKAQKIYESVLYNKDLTTFQYAVAFDSVYINSKFRTTLVSELTNVCDAFEAKTGIKCYISGLPFIRERMTKNVQDNMVKLLIISTIVVFLIITIFFRSMLDALVSVLLIIISTIWSFAFIVLLGYQITILNAIVPIIVVIITIPNCIFFLNEYYTLLQASRTKKDIVNKTLQEMIPVTFSCNIIASIGFLVFAFTGAELLVEFGMSAFLSIIMIFVSSVIILPFYLLLKKNKKDKYSLTKKFEWVKRIMVINLKVAFGRTKLTFGILLFLILVSIFGATQVYKKSSITDDLAKNDEVIKDMDFFQHELGGILVYNIIIDTKKKRGINKLLKYRNLKRLDNMITDIAQTKHLSNPISLLNYLKFFNQSLYDNEPQYYKVPTDLDLSIMNNFIKNITKNDKTDDQSPYIRDMQSYFIDKENRYLNIIFKMNNVNSDEFAEVKQDVANIFDKYFGDKFELRDSNVFTAYFAGNSIIVNTLWESVLFSILLIGLVVWVLFKNIRFLLITLFCNIVPMLFTLGIMGLFNIALKPSTVIIFSISFGICVDFSIRFLIGLIFTKKKYKNFSSALRQNIFHSGISIFYTSIFLIIGFLTFVFSDFLSLKYMGVLLSITIMGAVLMTLVVMPFFLKTFKSK